MNQLLIGSELGKNNLDVIRLLLAVLVIYSHSFVIIGSHTAEPAMIFTRNQIDLGSIAVNLFFIISGFLIFRSWEQSSSGLIYLKKRVLRICPGYFAAFLISILIIGPLASGNNERLLNLHRYFSTLNVGRLFFDLFTLQTPQAGECFSWLPMGKSVNSALWTIQYEFMCYLFVPLCALGGLLKRRTKVLIFLMILYMGFGLQFFFITAEDEKNIPFWLVELLNPISILRFLVYFFSGACFYLYRDKIVRNSYLALLCIILTFAGSHWTDVCVLILPFTSSYLLFYAAFHPDINLSGFSKKGDFSYGVYLYGWPAQQSVLFVLYHHVGVYSLFIISVIIAFAAAYFSWHCVEKVFLKLK